jgi:hypothetical protein
MESLIGLQSACIHFRYEGDCCVLVKACAVQVELHEVGGGDHSLAFKAESDDSVLFVKVWSGCSGDTLMATCHSGRDCGIVPCRSHYVCICKKWESDTDLAVSASP